MRKLSFFYIILLLVLVISTSCGGGSASSSIKGEEIPMRYADLLRMRQCDGYVYVQVLNPWDSASVLHSYILLDKTTPVPAQKPKGDIVRVPLENSVVYSLVHCALIDEIGGYGQIKGVCDLRYITMDKVQRDARNGNIRNLGEGLNPNIEDIIDMSPDAILLSPFQNSGGYGRLSKLGIPIIECADYMETSAMGRAEWIRFFGFLYGCEEQADSIFESVSRNYESLKQLAATAQQHPSVVTDLKYGATWYVPGGKSTTGMLLADAAANYIYKDNKENGSLALAPEVVFESAMDADVWIIRYNQAVSKTYDDIAQEYTNYSRMRAFTNQNIYACNTELVPFYSEVPFHPDRLLRDYIKILHPELLPDYNLLYYERITK